LTIRIQNGVDIEQQDEEFVGQLTSFIHEREMFEDTKEEKKIIGYNDDVEFSEYIGSDDEIEEVKIEKVEIKEEKLEINEKFKLSNVENFEILEDIEDHHYGDQPSNAKLSKIIQKEWKLLQENLPKEIYVKVSEKNINLMRAIIIGPENTPYNGGVFIFDIFLPNDYPVAYPKLFFWSYGSRLNPNLYETGKVCLSLLGTWEGRESCEIWNPNSSNILQILLSLLGLVLVSEPYV
jgi:ubiquitin-protein ligase